MPLEIVTPPAAEPLTLGEAKRYLRVDDSNTADDVTITAMITAAREWAENFTLRALVTQTLRLHLDAFPADAIVLPRPPLQQVVAVQYTDDAGQLEMLDPTYRVDTVSAPGRIFPALDEVWPATLGTPNAVTVEYIAGYGDAADVPGTIVAAIRLRLGTLYEHREGVVVGPAAAELPASQSAENLLYPHRVFYLA